MSDTLVSFRESMRGLESVPNGMFPDGGYEAWIDEIEAEVKEAFDARVAILKAGMEKSGLMLTVAQAEIVENVIFGEIIMYRKRCAAVADALVLGDDLADNRAKLIAAKLRELKIRE